MLYICTIAEDMIYKNGSKEKRYRSVTPQTKFLLIAENDLFANCAHMCSS